MTIVHTQGKLVSVADARPGDVIYLCPHHKRYIAGNFAIKLAALSHGAAQVMRLSDATAILVLDATSRTVERVSVDFAAQIEGQCRQNIRRAAQRQRDEAARATRGEP